MESPESRDKTDLIRQKDIDSFYNSSCIVVKSVLRILQKFSRINYGSIIFKRR